MSEGQHRVIAGFWARLAALLIDSLILGVIGFAISFPFGEWFVVAGAWGRAIGFIIALGYFGIFNSMLGGGQTPGKRLLKVKVVDRTGGLLPLQRSMLRFLPIGAAWFLNGVRVPHSLQASPPVSVGLSIAVFGLGLSIVYLYVFNRRTRQSVHDLVVGSYVVKAATEGQVPALDPWRVHYGIVAALLVASAAAPFAMQGWLASQSFDSLLRIYQTMNAQPGVIDAQVVRGTQVMKGRPRSTFLSLVVYSSNADVENAQRARQLAVAGFAAAGDAENSVDTVVLTAVYGYDIGIWSLWRTHRFSFTPRELARGNS